MPTGRKPKPTKLKLVDGNPGKKTINKKEPQPDSTMPQPPSWLDRTAKRKWRTLGEELNALGLLTSIDQDAFAAYCTAFSRWRTADDFIKKNGSVYVVTNKWDEKIIKRFPQVSIAVEQMKLMNSLAAEFGLTPSSRSRINIGGIEASDAEEWLFGAK